MASLSAPPRIVDTDVHHSAPDRAALLPYLPAALHERYRDFGASVGNPYFNNGGVRGRRADSFPAGTQDAGGDYVQLREQLLEAAHIDIAILTGSTAYEASVVPDVDYGTAVCRAFNDFTTEHWLAHDRRLRFAVAVNHQDPAAAAHEIERMAAHPQVVGVLLPTGAWKPFGNRFYDPIYAACAETGLTPTLHLGTEGLGMSGTPVSSGWPSYYVESRLARPGVYGAHLASLLFEGTFEKFPTLKVAFIECGISWIPPFLWRADADWKGLRYQTPWVKRLPSEYVRDHVRFNTQPLDEPPTDRDLDQVLAWMHADRTLMFGTDYPHWDYDDPANTLRHVEPGLRARIFAGNALETFPRLGAEFATPAAARPEIVSAA